MGVGEGLQLAKSKYHISFGGRDEGLRHESNRKKKKAASVLEKTSFAGVLWEPGVSICCSQMLFTRGDYLNYISWFLGLLLSPD